MRGLAICSFIACANAPGSHPRHGQGVLVEDLATPNIPQIHRIPIDIEYTPSPPFTSLVSPIITLTIPYDL